MTDRLTRLTDERIRLNERLKQLNVHSTGRDRVVERVEMIGRELQRLTETRKPFKTFKD